MKRSDMLQKLQQSHSYLNDKTVELAVNSLFNFLAGSLVLKHRIELRGFGCFSVKDYPPKIVRNPKSGAVIQKDKTLSIHFKAAKNLKSLVNQKILELA